MRHRSHSEPTAPAWRADEIVAESESLVRLWDHAEDWTVPRIPPSQVKVLGLMRYRGQMNLSTLAHEIGAIPSSASRLCDRLEAAGLVQREVFMDNRREIQLSLTKEGRRRLDSFDEARHQAFTPVLERMSAQSRDALLMGLRDFSAAAHEARTSEATA